MKYENLRQTGEDIDLIVDEADHNELTQKHLGYIWDLLGNTGIYEMRFGIKFAY